MGKFGCLQYQKTMIMKYVTSNLLDQLYAQSELHLEIAIAGWQQLPATILNAAPSPGSWSAASCLEHLNSYGRYYLPAIEKAIDSADGSIAGAHYSSGWLGNYFYSLMLPGTPAKPSTKMKAPKAHRPPTQLNPILVLSEFISQQEKLEQLLTRCATVNLATARVPISIAPFIRLQLGDVLLFNSAHIHRHLLQAQNALKLAGYAPSQSSHALKDFLPAA